jgi:hypothetical protein
MNNYPVNKTAFYFIATFWVLGLLVHLTALWRGYDLPPFFPFVWGLLWGTLVVWLFDRGRLRRILKQKTLAERSNANPLWKSIFENIPNG